MLWCTLCIDYLSKIWCVILEYFPQVEIIYRKFYSYVFPESVLEQLNYIIMLPANMCSKFTNNLPIFGFMVCVWGGGWEQLLSNLTDAQLYLKFVSICFPPIMVPPFQPTTTIHFPLRILTFTSNHLQFVFLFTQKLYQIRIFFCTLIFGI